MAGAISPNVPLHQFDQVEERRRIEPIIRAAGGLQVLDAEHFGARLLPLRAWRSLFAGAGALLVSPSARMITHTSSPARYDDVSCRRSRKPHRRGGPR